MKSERERQIYDIIYMWNLKYDINELIYGYQSVKGMGEGTNHGFGIGRYKYLYLK